MVYFISDQLGNIKIGIAKNVNDRLKGLQTSNPNELVIRDVFYTYSDADDSVLESSLHDHFKAACIRENGEWFKEPPVMEWLDAMKDKNVFSRIPFSHNKIENTVPAEQYIQMNNINDKDALGFLNDLFAEGDDTPVKDDSYFNCAMICNDECESAANRIDEVLGIIKASNGDLTFYVSRTRINKCICDYRDTADFLLKYQYIIPDRFESGVYVVSPSLVDMLSALGVSIKENLSGYKKLVAIANEDYEYLAARSKKHIQKNLKQKPLPKLPLVEEALPDSNDNDAKVQAAEVQDEDDFHDLEIKYGGILDEYTDIKKDDIFQRAVGMSVNNDIPLKKAAAKLLEDADSYYGQMEGFPERSKSDNTNPYRDKKRPSMSLFISKEHMKRVIKIVNTLETALGPFSISFEDRHNYTAKAFDEGLSVYMDDAPWKRNCVADICFTETYHSVPHVKTEQEIKALKDAQEEKLKYSYCFPPKIPNTDRVFDGVLKCKIKLFYGVSQAGYDHFTTKEMTFTDKGDDLIENHVGEIFIHLLDIAKWDEIRRFKEEQGAAFAEINKLNRRLIQIKKEELIKNAEHHQMANNIKDLMAEYIKQPTYDHEYYNWAMSVANEIDPLYNKTLNDYQNEETIKIKKEIQELKETFRITA